MGVDLKIIANHKLSFSEPEKVIEKLTKKINMDFANPLLAWYKNLYQEDALPLPKNEIVSFVNKEFDVDWKAQWKEKDFLVFHGPLCSISVNENYVDINFHFRFGLYAQNYGNFNEFLIFVKGLMTQIGGSEAIFLPDCPPYVKRGVDLIEIDGQPINIKELNDCYQNKIFPMKSSYDEIKISLLKGYGKPCQSSEEIDKKAFFGYFIDTILDKNLL
ncbi:MAG: hypothetical protein HXX09_09870 [Bacteroidetes bacterium]|nr:hypothetical protein [Bacteroidota bacterium]